MKVSKMDQLNVAISNSPIGEVRAIIGRRKLFQEQE